jgi:16S rRNA processing protein RimM
MSPRNTAREQNSVQLPDPFLEAGRIIRPHGIRGQVVIASEAHYFAQLQAGTVLFLNPGDKQVTIRSIRSHQGRFLVALDDFSSCEEAETLRNMRVFLDSTELPELKEGEYFHWQLIGLIVRDNEGHEIGTVKSILETGANDVYILEDNTGHEKLVPAISDVVSEINLEEGVITINPLPGLFPE